MKVNKAAVITIDGPSGSGKSTVGPLVAAELGWHYFDSGALYRLFSCYCLEQGIINIADAEIGQLYRGFSWEVQGDVGNERYLLSGIDVSERLRDEAIGKLASDLGKIAELRELLVEDQRRMRRSPGLVTDGRDMGTTIFPNADLKIYLVADLEVRAQRRLNQLHHRNQTVSIDEVSQALALRDAQDSQRAASPLCQPQDAWLLDSSAVDVDDIVASIKDRVLELDL